MSTAFIMARVRVLTGILDHMHLPLPQALLVLLIALTAAPAVRAQALPQDPAVDPGREVASQATGQLVITARDSLEGRLPGATVRIEGQDAPSPIDAGVIVTDAEGEATVDLAPGDYRVVVEMPGFEPVTLDVSVTSGRTERAIATLALGGFAEQVAVSSDAVPVTPTPDGQVETLTAEEIDQLPDNPEELALVLEALAGAEAEFRVNGFEGGELPPKQQIQAVRIRRDPFAPDNMGGGRPRVEIITRPGMSTWGHEVNVGFRDQSVDARQPFADVRGAGQTRRVSWNFNGPLVRNRTSISGRLSLLDSFEAQPIVALGAGTGLPSLVNQQRGWLSGEVRLEHALNGANTLRAEYQRRDSSGENLGVGEFDLPQRAYEQDTVRDIARVSAMSTVGTLLFNEFRLEFIDAREDVRSASDAVIVNVQNAFTSGGAQRRGGRRERELEIANTIDFLRGGRHKVRVGFEGEFGWSRTDRIDNFTGTFTFASLEDFEAGRPRQFVQRTGNPLVSYARYEVSWFAYDEITLSKGLRVGLGLRHDLQNLVDTTWNLAPRASVSWTPGGEGPTTLTAGIGVFNDWYQAGIYEQTLQLDGTRQRDLIIRDPAFPDPFAGEGVDIELPPPSIIRETDEIAMQTSQRVSLGAEHRLTPAVRLQLNLFGQFTQDRLRSLNVNAPVGGVRPDVAFDRITEIRSIGRARSAGFDSSVRVQWLQGRGSGLLRYRYAQAWNDADGALSLPADSRDLDAEWAPSSGDVRHRIFGFVRTELPLGVRVNLWGDIQSGAPYTIRTGFDDNGDTIFNDRPTGVSRNTERGTWQRTVNLRVGWRPWAPSSRGPGAEGGERGGRGGRGGRGQQRGVELYAEAWNLFNETNYTRFAGVLTSPLFGRPTAAAPARRFNFGTRVFF